MTRPASYNQTLQASVGAAFSREPSWVLREILLSREEGL